MKSYFIHIGMPRTATTFFQTHLFPHLPGISYYGLPYTLINPAFNRMLFEDDSTFEPDKFKNEIDQLTGDKLLISNENFTGQSIFLNFGNRTRIAQRLHAAMPEATIILFLRNQPDILKSLYLIALQEHETSSLEEYIRFPKKTEYTLDRYKQQPKVDLFDFAYFDSYHANENISGYFYTALITLYKQLFPRVELFLFEDFKHDPKGVLTRLAQITGSELPDPLLQNILSAPAVNESINSRQAQQLRRLNRWYHVLWPSRVGRAFYVRARRNIINHPGTAAKVDWKPEQLQRLEQIFKDDNRQLHEQYPALGLDRYSKSYFL